MFRKIYSSSPSRLINCWRIKVNNKKYLFTPAHVAIYAKGGKWRLSEFMSDVKNLEWRVPVGYVSNPNPFHDLAWAETTGDDDDFLTLKEEIVAHPTQVNIVFRQPYNWKGGWNGTLSTLGSTMATLYPSPSTSALEGEFSDCKLDLLEAIDIGFKGMSGAVALSPEGDCVGMFVKRGTLIPFKQSIKPNFESQKFTGIARIFRDFVGLTNQSHQLDYLVANCLVKDDLSEVGVVVDARRGIFLPATALASINDVASIDIADVVDKAAPRATSQ